MFKNGSLLKWGLLFLIGLGGIFGCQPVTDDPEIIDASVVDTCDVQIEYIDHAHTESMVFLKRRVAGSNFVQIKVADYHGDETSSFLDEDLPAGVYEYQVGYLNPNTAKYSNISAEVVIDETCGTEPIAIKPLNPILSQVQVISGCTARIWLVTYAEDSDGVRIYRKTPDGQPEKVAELSMSKWNSGVGYYDDQNLPMGTYLYQGSTFNSNGEAFSEWSKEVVISDAGCKPADVPPELVSIPDTVLVTPTIQYPTPVSQRCIWEAVENIFTRKGPGVAYDKFAAIEKGKSLPIIGQSEDGEFWVVEVQPGLPGYVIKAEKYSRASGDCQDIPTLDDPERPVIESTPTIVPPANDGGNENATPQCSDGIDNDGDGAIDMRDLRGCTDPKDATED